MAHSVPLRDYLRQRAAWVWNQQGHAFDHGLALQEETLTEMLLLRIAQDQTRHGLTVTMFSKAEEAKNGADWEWVVRTSTCSLWLRVQAKRLYHRSRKVDYGGLDPKSGQTAKLIRQAGGRAPVYVFFNHDHGLNSDLLASGGHSPYRGRSFWGCSVAGAKEVQAAKSNKLSDLKKCMRPWHRLITPSGACEATASLGAAPRPEDAAVVAPWFQTVEQIRDRDFMSTYLDNEELAGFAYLDFRKFKA